MKPSNGKSNGNVHDSGNSNGNGQGVSADPLQAPMNRIEEIFHQALSKTDRQREEYLHDACGNDRELRESLEHLIRAHDVNADFLERPVSLALIDEPHGADSTDDDSCRGKQLGGFELRRVIASGGMGTVYEAMQTQPRRIVALKVLRAASSSPEALRRFHQEAQVLAGLRHPGIAQIYSAGAERDGASEVPYIAMEYIPTCLSLVEYVCEKELTVTQRLELFVKVCDAVQYGHQLGVIHRDLKPANILVDPSGQPKVIDFGVARVADAALSQGAMHTSIGQLIGTPAYMSPEQFDADPRSVDTRSDVYALGVILYELLCGRLPFETRNRSLSDIALIVQRSAPEKPSALSADLKGDLETIVLKALAKEPDRRYASVSELSCDIRRFIRREPILARPSSMRYQLGLYARRNRAKVFAASLAVTAVMLGAAISSLFGVRAVHAARGEASQRDRAERVNAFLSDLITSASPYRLGRNASVVDLLRDANERIESEFADQPIAEADIRHTMAKTYAGLWYWKDVEQQTSQALRLYRQSRAAGEKIADCLTLLGRSYTFLGMSGAIEAHREAIAIRKRIFGASHPAIADSLGCLAFAHWGGNAAKDFDEAERFYKAGLEMFAHSGSPTCPQAARCAYSYGAMLHQVGRFEECEQQYRNAVAIYRSLPPSADSYRFEVTNNLAGLLISQGKKEEGEALSREAIALNPQGFKHDRVSPTIWTLAGLCHNRKEFDEALAYYRQALANDCRKCATWCRESTNELLELADSLESPRVGALYPYPYLDAIKALRKARDHDDWFWTKGTHNIADALSHVDPAAAVELARYSMDLTDVTLSPEHWLRADTASILGACLTSLGQFDEAEKLLLESFPIIQADSPPELAFSQEARDRIVKLYEAKGDAESADRWRKVGAKTPDAG